MSTQPQSNDLAVEAFILNDKKIIKYGDYFLNSNDSLFGLLLVQFFTSYNIINITY